MSADSGRRARWAAALERAGMRTLRCAGPLVNCAILAGRECPFLPIVDFAFYDRASLVPDVVRALSRATGIPPIFAASDSPRGLPADLRRIVT